MPTVTKSEVFLVGCAAVIVGFLFIGPPLAIRHAFEKNDKEFVLAQLKTYRDELYMYIPRAREIYDGHFPPTDLSYDDAQSVTPQNAVTSLLLSSFVFLFGGNMNVAYLTAQFVFSAVIFVLLYITGRMLLRSKSWSFLMATVGILTPILIRVFAFDFKGDAKIFFDFTAKQFLPFVRTQMDKLSFARIDHPLLVYPFFLLAVISFAAFLKKPTPKNAVFSGVTAGILSYVYLHTWVFWTIVLGLVFVQTIFFGQDAKIKKNFALLFIAYLLTLIPYIINYYYFSLSPSYNDISNRFAVFKGRDLGIFKLNALDYAVYILMAASVLLIKLKRKSAASILDRNILFLSLGLITSSMIVWNIQIITGQSTAFFKWRYPVALGLYLVFFILAYELFQLFSSERAKIKKICEAVVVCAALLVFSKYTFNTFSLWLDPSKESLAYYKFLDDTVSSWKWINYNLDSEPKIISPSFTTSDYLMAYTSARPFLPMGHLSMASNFDLEERFLISRKLFNIPRESLEEQLEGGFYVNCRVCPDFGINANKTSFQIYGDGFEKTLRQYLFDARWNGVAGKPVGKIEELMDRYDRITPVLDNGDADYAYYGPWEKQLGSDLSGFQFGAKKQPNVVFRNSSVSIYKISED